MSSPWTRHTTMSSPKSRVPMTSPEPMLARPRDRVPIVDQYWIVKPFVSGGTLADSPPDSLGPLPERPPPPRCARHLPLRGRNGRKQVAPHSGGHAAEAGRESNPPGGLVTPSTVLKTAGPHQAS